MPVRPDALDRIYALWNELAGFPAAAVDGALRHLMSMLADWTRADNVVWVGGVRLRQDAGGERDPQHGWRGRAVTMLHPSPQRLRRSALAARQQDSEPAMTTVALTAAAGRFRVHRLRDGFVDFERFRQTVHYDLHYRQTGVRDRLWVLVPVSADTESWFLLDRTQGRGFAAADAALAGHCLRGLPWFHRKLLLSHGLPGPGRPFTPSQRRVLALLLSDATEAEIATRLHLSRGTVHQYAVELYRKLGVKGRTGLLSLWLGHSPLAHAPVRIPTDQ